jgi:SMC interacting uncharacterized protein involved in chromosome segregation
MTLSTFRTQQAIRQLTGELSRMQEVIAAKDQEIAPLKEENAQLRLQLNTPNVP